MEWYLIMILTSDWNGAAKPDTARTIASGFESVKECEHEINRLIQDKGIRASNAFVCSKKPINNYKRVEIK